MAAHKALQIVSSPTDPTRDPRTVRLQVDSEVTIDTVGFLHGPTGMRDDPPRVILKRKGGFETGDEAALFVWEGIEISFYASEAEEDGRPKETGLLELEASEMAHLPQLAVMFLAVVQEAERRGLLVPTPVKEVPNG